jgi:hypothetical protein
METTTLNRAPRQLKLPGRVLIEDEGNVLPEAATACLVVAHLNAHLAL